MSHLTTDCLAHRWPRASSTRGSAGFKARPEDFFVEEQLAFEPCGTGEHAYLLIEKTAMTTDQVARELARVTNVHPRDVGYAGLKDKQSVARQWFSVPGQVAVDLVPNDGWRIVERTQHTKKLRRGEVGANRFTVVLRQTADFCVDTWLQGEPFPNYYGPQRFGWDNLTQARQWLAVRRNRRVSRFKQGLYLSVLRAFVFNEVLAARVRDDSWQRRLDGDCVDDSGFVTGPMWGRGRSATAGAAASIESAALTEHAELLEALEYTGLRQDRRPLVGRAQGLSAEALDHGTWSLSFTLASGSYATVFLGEHVALREALP